jgi:tripartite-type tricarboxylate transporter receptor subunit TctC
MEAVLYKGGGPAMADLVAGHVNCYFGNYNELLPHAGGGRVRILATSGEKRARQLPDVPTVAEQGYPGFESVGWIGLAAPARTPPAILDRLNAEIKKMLQDPAVKARFEQLAFTPVGDSRAEFAAFVKSEIAKWSKVAKDSGAKAD